MCVFLKTVLISYFTDVPLKFNSCLTSYRFESFLNEIHSYLAFYEGAVFQVTAVAKDKLFIKTKSDKQEQRFSLLFCNVSVMKIIYGKLM